METIIKWNKLSDIKPEGLYWEYTPNKTENNPNPVKTHKYITKIYYVVYESGQKIMRGEWCPNEDRFIGIMKKESQPILWAEIPTVEIG